MRGPMNPLFANLPTSIFEHMSGLARAHRAINLGQGFPDFGWPDDVLERAAEAVRSGWNRTTSSPGSIRANRLAAIASVAPEVTMT